MKIKNLIKLVALLLGVFIVQACVTEEEDLFGKSGAERLNDAQKLYEKILISAPNGWVLEYIAGDTDNTRRGAFNYLLKFEDDGTVKVAVDALAMSDINPSSSDLFKTETSLYRFDQDMSVTLSFSSYNPLIHFYHEQHGSYTTYKGDYEFTIMEAYDDLMVLRGKKYGNIMEMHRMPESVTWNEYLQEVNNTIDAANIYTKFELVQDGNIVGTGDLNNNFRYTFSINNEKDKQSSNAIYTTTGIKFIEPLSINGAKAQNFRWDDNTKTFISTDEGVKVNIVPKVAPDYIYYEQFIGNYTLTHSNNVNLDVSIEQGIKGKTLILKGMVDFDIELIYDKVNGAIGLVTQDVGKADGYTVTLAPWEASTGYYTWGVGYGTKSVVNLGKEPFEFRMVDNGGWGSRKAEGYLLRLFDSVLGSHGSATAKGNYTKNSTGYRFSNLAFVKK